jgi:hypothetical protein
MKLNNLQKNFYIFFSVIISIFIATLLWDKITLPLSSNISAKGYLVSIGYNPNNDTIRYIFFISLPLIAFLFSSYIFNNNYLKIKEIIFENEKNIESCHPILIVLSLIFVFFILFEFFSLNFSFSNYRLDYFHDGNYLGPAQNYLSNKSIWTSSYLVHGASDIFYPILMWKILGVETIGAARTLNIFLILFLKFFSILLSYQFTKISNLDKNSKIVFFTIFTAIIISMSKYAFLEANYYFHHRDIYIIVFLISFIELFIQSKFRLFSIIFICLLATVTILLHIDTGVYINFILFFYFLYLIFSTKYKDALLIFLLLLFFWIVAINLIGFDEFKAFVNNTKVMILSMDLIHGLKYPEPFFSIGENPNGTRATRGILLQLTAGLFVLNALISNKRKIFSSKNILFIFLFMMSFIMYKNALGRSDAPHLRASADLPILINSFFILNYLLIFLEKKFLTNKIFFYKIVLTLSFFFLLFYYTFNYNHYSIDKVKNYKKDFIKFINFKDEIFLNTKTKNLVRYYGNLIKNENCVENITFDDTIPYLLKKPSCTKYWASWLASPIDLQKDYVKKLQKVRPEYILYSSTDLEFDGIEIYDRINLVNSYVMSEYKRYDEFDGYIILKKK